VKKAKNVEIRFLRAIIEEMRRIYLQRRYHLRLIHGLAWLLIGQALASRPASAQELRPLGGDVDLARFPETSAARAALEDELLMAVRDKVLAFKDRTLDTRDGPVRVSVRKKTEAFYILFSPPKAGVYSDYAQGTWIIKRSMADGAFLQAKVFMRSDPGIFIRLFPAQDRTKLEFVVYGGILSRDVLLPVPFAEVLRLPMSRIVDMSASAVDWSLLSPDPGLYAPVRAMVAGIRSGLPRLRYVDDGAVDAAGRAVLIASGKAQTRPYGLNCSGFAKWIVDGIYAAVGAEAGDASLSDIGRLKLRDFDNRGNSFSAPFEESRDVYFGLDWIRGLATELMGRLYPGMAVGRTDMDVDIPPFSSFIPGRDIFADSSASEHYPAFEPEAGYQARGLEALLYVLACRDPGAFYLGSRSFPQYEDPELRQHSHILAFFPYFDEEAVFRIAVFESAAETSMANVINRRSDYFMFLVRLPADDRFDPRLATWRED
jgi:hypothetical protein